MTDLHPPFTAVRAAVAIALTEDLAPIGDMTAALVDPEVVRSVAFVTREPGVVAGRRCAEESLAQVDGSIEVFWLVDDGGEVKAGDVIATARGSLRSILSGERTALNFLRHLSGIATVTRQFVDATGGAAVILDTRKTTPGLRAIEKAAVRAGGGANHRGSLSDGVLIKDNHLASLTITEAVRRARAAWPGRLVEVECDTVAQVDEATTAGATMVLLDNMDPDTVREAVALVAGRTLVEVSGRMSLEAVPGYAAIEGVDYISVGAITHSAPALDIGLDLEG
ncbi:MAG: carboxylating nicotinate-nucleotide diphosphorylase [Acidimicrobiales bacterium]